MNEVHTCRQNFVPALVGARWENTPHSIAEVLTTVRAAQNKTIAEVNALLASVLDRAFRGEL